MRRYYLLLLIISIFTLQGFSQQTMLKTGAIINTVFCISDSTQSYAIYLPSNYDVNKKMPVLFGFEPRARGKLPVEKYQALAEKYHFIIACSNNSKNGPWEPSEYAAKTMMNDILHRLNIDQNQMYTFGFSGGGRLAILLAMQNNKISGVISSGAGFPYNKNPDFAYQFNIVIPIGIRDMNYPEIKKLDAWLTYIEMEHTIIPFNGVHAWPNQDIFEEAVIHLFLLQNFKENKSDIVEFYHQKEKELEHDSILLNRRIYILNTLSHIEDQLSLTKKHAINYNSFVKSENYKSFIDLEKSILKEESQIQENILHLFIRMEQENVLDQKALKQIKKTIDQLISSENRLKRDSGIRLNNFLIGNSFERVYHFFNQNKYDLAISCNTILTFITPSNEKNYYRAAQIYATANKPSSCIKSLEKAIEFGFDQIQMINKDHFFQKIKDEKSLKSS